MNIKTMLITGSLVLFSGCASTQNPFGVGYEHSACEVSAGFGVCGSPLNIYKYKEKIKYIQDLYLQSGIKQDLFFSVNDQGRILVKTDRTGRWQDYESSKWKQILENPDARFTPQNQDKSLFGRFFSKNKDIPQPRNPNLTPQRHLEEDLAVDYKKRGQILSSRTNIGNIIRDNGTIQKVWVAPYVDKKGDLISAHHLYTVVKSPKWIIGETPNIRVPKRTADFPTPLSKDVLEGDFETNTKDENTLQDYSINVDADFSNTPPPPPMPEEDPETDELKNFVGE